MKRSTTNIILLILFCVFYVVKFGLSIAYLFFVSGVVIGYYFWLFEVLFRVFYLSEDQALRASARQLVKQRKITILWRFLIDTKREVKLTSESVVFLLIYLPLAVFMLTSTGSVLGIGLILGLGLHYTFDIFNHRHDHQLIQQTYLAQLSKSYSSQQIEKFAWVVLLSFLLLSVLVLK